MLCCAWLQATRLVPGSHRWPQHRIPLESEVVYAEMSVGSVVFISGMTYHSAGGNSTDTPRLGMNLDFNVGFVAEEEVQVRISDCAQSNPHTNSKSGPPARCYRHRRTWRDTSPSSCSVCVATTHTVVRSAITATGLTRLQRLILSRSTGLFNPAPPPVDTALQV